ncbi:MAG: hypothetical protein Q7S88_00880 [Candidatus Daviesbacteria bacterium]|nr:hypothetical protein [Candidatus Daviesbacteria bacterium]
MAGERLGSAFLPEEVVRPIVLNQWGSGNEAVYLLALPHNDNAVDPFSDCTGTVTIIFKRGMRGDKQTACRGCLETVMVNLSQAWLSVDRSGESSKSPLAHLTR